MSEWLKPIQARSQKILLGSAFEEKLDLLVQPTVLTPGAVEAGVCINSPHS